MLNDREDKYEVPEESEYHFSDDDATYEVDAETPKPVVVPEPKESILTRLSSSKRMLVVGVVFLVLVFVIYKMVSPSNSTPSTDIVPAVVSVATPTKPLPIPARVPNVTNVVATKTPAITITTTTSKVPTTPITANPPAVPLQMPNLQQSASTQASQATLTPEQIAQRQQSSMPTSPVAAPAMPTEAPSQPIVSAQIPSQVPVNQMSAPSNSTPSADSGLASMAATNAKLMSQLQTEYAQKLDNYATQSKALQEQMQTLNTRVAGLESQLTQLVQTLNRQAQPAQNATNAAPQGPTAVTTDARLGYNVQAIIPGRAWLRSDNGDTVTVAEGDVIKDVGRVTKIDPYDGIVEINTGNHTVSLSYGNGG